MRKKIFIVKEVEATLDEGRLKDLDLSVNLYCYETLEEAKECIKDLYAEKIYNEFNLDINEEEDAREFEETQDGYMDAGISEFSAYIHAWDEFGMGRNWDLTITNESIDLKEEK